MLNIKAEPKYSDWKAATDPIVFNIEQSGLSDKATSVTVKLDLQDVDASDIDSIVLTNTDGSTQTITVADAIAGIKVSIPAGTAAGDMPSIAITPKQDDIYEQLETLGMNLSSPVNATIGTGTATGDILDESDNSEDPFDGSNTEGDKPVVSISATDNQAIEGIDNTLVFTVSQTKISNFDTTVTVSLGASDIDASDIASITYTNANGEAVTLSTQAQIQNFFEKGDKVTIPAGSTQASAIIITVVDDTVYEKSEDMVLEISRPVNAVLGQASDKATILDEDATDGTPNDGDKPTVTVSGASAVEGDILVHKVTLSHTTQTEVSYPFELKDGSAKAGEDYSNTPTPTFSNGVTYDPVAGTITVPAGVTEFTVSYPTTADNIDESDETTGLTIDGVTGTGTILDNNATPVLNIKAEPNTAIEGSDDPIVFNIEQSGLSDKATSVTVKLDLQDVDASDIDSIVLTNTDGSTQTITVADAIAGIKVSIPAGTAADDMPSIAITPKQDDIYEQLETLGMNLS
ncbi:hypothetical protein LK453_00005, partial [Psychrobacter sanguinis]